MDRFLVDSNESKAYLHPLIYFRIFDPTGLIMHVIFVAFGLSSLLASSPRSPPFLFVCHGKIGLLFFVLIPIGGRIDLKEWAIEK